MSNKNFGWHDIIEYEAHYYQSDFSMSNILGQLSDYNDILNRQIQAIKITSNDRLLSLSIMRATAQEHQPANSSAIMSLSEKSSEDHGKEAVEDNKRDEIAKATKSVEEDAVEGSKRDK